jgi:hypothetical protein
MVREDNGHPATFPRSRNRREWSGSKNGHDLFEAIVQMGKLGLRIQRAKNARQMVLRFGPPHSAWSFEKVEARGNGAEFCNS